MNVRELATPKPLTSAARDDDLATARQFVDRAKTRRPYTCRAQASALPAVAPAVLDSTNPILSFTLGS
jgi:hypothetical protein